MPNLHYTVLALISLPKFNLHQPDQAGHCHIMDRSLVYLGEKAGIRHTLSGSFPGERSVDACVHTPASIKHRDKLCKVSGAVILRSDLKFMYGSLGIVGAKI